MAECEEVEAVSKTRYVKIKQNSCTADSEKCESEEATGGETTTDEIVEEPIFLETTV